MTMTTTPRFCEYIREDALECTQKPEWIISPNEDPYDYSYVCHNHLHKLIPRDDTAYVGHLGDRDA